MLLKLKPLSLALSSSALLLLSACGGGDGDGTAAPEVPSGTTTLSGTVTIDQAIQNAVVCLDLNANNACDVDEPVSAKTGADGAYSLSYDSAKVTADQAATASLIAPMVPGAATDAATTLDAAKPDQAATAAAYVLRQIPGKSGAINPLTTLVAAGVSAGMTEAAARANVATQLAIADAKIDNYQDDANSDVSQIQDNARTAAKVTAAALGAGAELRVGDQAAAQSAEPGALATLRYADAGNYFVRTLDGVAKPAGETTNSVKDARTGMTKGVATADADLYTQAYNSNGTWTFCNASTLISVTTGNPSRSTYCNAQQSVGFTQIESIDGQSMSSVVTAMQATQSSNTINNGDSTTVLLAKLGTNTFPTSANLQQRASINFSQPLIINNVSTDGFGSATTLEQVISGSPAAAVKLASGKGTLGLGLGTSDTTVLRVAFTGTTSPTAGTVQFYECDYNAIQNTIANCKTTQTGTYSIATVDGVRAIRYAGNAETVMNHTRLHAEVPGITGLASAGPRVYVVRETKPSVSAESGSTRLNVTAWASMRAVLGL